MKHTVEVERALAERFKAPEYAFLLQVRNQTGYTRTIRTCDAVAMSLWPSRGLTFEGIEIKVSRSDWLAEKKDIEKSAEFFKFCDRWWLAVGDEDIVKPGELPANWGLLVPRGDKMICRKEAPLLAPEAPSLALLAGVMRNAAEAQAGMVRKSSLTTELQAARNEGREAQKQDDDYQIGELRRSLGRHEQTIKDFEAASGLKLNHYQAGEIGTAVQAVMNGSGSQLDNKLKELLNAATNVRNHMLWVMEQARSGEDGMEWHI